MLCCNDCSELMRQICRRQLRLSKAMLLIATIGKVLNGYSIFQRAARVICLAMYFHVFTDHTAIMRSEERLID